MIDRRERVLSRQTDRAIRLHLLPGVACRVGLAVLPVILADSRPALDLARGARVRGEVRRALGGVINTTEEALGSGVDVPTAILHIIIIRVQWEANKSQHKRIEYH